MKNKQRELNRTILEDICLKCFYLNYEEDEDTFVCDKYRIGLDGILENCPGFTSISEGLNELIMKMKAEGGVI